MSALQVIEGFTALCELCDWTGAPRRSNLTALQDYDAHVIGGVHTGKRLAQPVPGDLIILGSDPAEDGTVTVVELDSTADAPDSYEVRASDGTSLRVIRSSGVAREWLAV